MKFKFNQTVKIISLDNKNCQYANILNNSFLNKKVKVMSCENIRGNILYVCTSPFAGDASIVILESQLRALRPSKAKPKIVVKPITLADELTWMDKIQSNFKQPKDEMMGRYGSLDAQESFMFGNIFAPPTSPPRRSIPNVSYIEPLMEVQVVDPDEADESPEQAQQAAEFRGDQNDSR